MESQGHKVKWSGLLLWSAPGSTCRQVLTRLSAGQDIPQDIQHDELFDLWPDKLQLQLTPKQTVNKILPYISTYFTVEVTAQSGSDLDLLTDELSSGKVSLTFFTDSAYSGWGLVVAISNDRVLKGIVFLWQKSDSQNHSQLFMQCLSSLQHEIHIDWSKLRRLPEPSANQDSLQDTGEDMHYNNPYGAGPSGPRNHHSVHSPYIAQPKRDNTFREKNYRNTQGSLGRFLNNHSNLSTANEKFQGIRRDSRSPVRQNSKPRPEPDRQSGSPIRPLSNPKNQSQNTEKRPLTPVRRYRSPVRRPRSPNPNDQSWKSARKSQGQSRNFESPIRLNPQEPVTQPCTPVGQQCPNPNTQDPNRSDNKSFKRSQSLQSNRKKVKHSADTTQGDKSFASTSNQLSIVNSSQETKIKKPQKKQAKQEVTFFKVEKSPPEKPKQTHPSNPVNSVPTSQDWPITSTTINRPVDMQINKPPSVHLLVGSSTSTSQRKVSRWSNNIQQRQSPLSGTDANQVAWRPSNNQQPQSSVPLSNVNQVLQRPNNSQQPQGPLPDSDANQMSRRPSNSQQPQCPLPDSNANQVSWRPSNSQQPQCPLPDSNANQVSRRPNNSQQPQCPLPDSNTNQVSRRPNNSQQPQCPLPDSNANQVSRRPSNSQQPQCPLPDSNANQVSRHPNNSQQPQSPLPDSIVNQLSCHPSNSQQPQSPLSDSNTNQPTTTQDGTGEQDMESEVMEHLQSLQKLLKCCICERWVMPVRLRSCLCSLACVECTAAVPNCTECHMEMTENANLSCLYLRISSVISHPCPFEGCSKIVKPNDLHEASCKYKPFECVICNLNILKSSAWAHFEDQHPQQMPLREGVNTNVLATQFWTDFETGNKTICCFIQERFLSITLNKYDDLQTDAQFLVRKLTEDNDINVMIKMYFKKDDWECSRQNTKKRSMLLSTVNVPLSIVEAWLKGESTLFMTIGMRPKRKINRKNNSVKKRKRVSSSNPLSASSAN